jgi:transcriptional regulator GlxA family with amidase domain
MKHLTILVPDSQAALSTVSCIAGAYDFFSRANHYRKINGQKELFKIVLAGLTDEAEIGNGLMAIRPQTSIDDVPVTDLIIIPAIAHDFQKLSANNSLLMDWTLSQYKNGAEVATMCTGAFMLASSGLLDGKSCSIHWNSVDKLRNLFPLIEVRKDQLITDEQGIYTNGGAYSFLNLLIYLVEKYYGRETAIYCSKIFQVEIDRQTQSAFTIFNGQKSHGDDIVKQAQEFFEDNFLEKISVEEVSQKFAVGRRNFDRRFVKATGNTPIEYLQRVKVESAKKSFETTRKTVSEVMYESGYNDMKAFREVFRKVTGLTPLEYKQKFNKEALV